MSIPCHCIHHWYHQSQWCLQWSYAGNIEVDGVLVVDERGTRVTWEVQGRLQSEQPYKSQPSYANNLQNAFHQVLGWYQFFIKLWWHLLSCSPFSLHCNTDCHYWHTLCSSTRSSELLLQNIFPVPASLSVSMHVYTYELMYGYYWCVKAPGMLTCFRYDISCVW